MTPDTDTKESAMTRHQHHRHVNPDGSRGGWVHDSATVDPTATIWDGARVGSFAWVGARAEILPGARVEAGAAVGADARVGRGTRVGPRAEVRSGVWTEANTEIEAAR